jgi:hypothetical protein
MDVQLMIMAGRGISSQLVTLIVLMGQHQAHALIQYMETIGIVLL